MQISELVGKAALSLSVAALLAAAPYNVVKVNFTATLSPAAAYAKDGRSGGGGDSSGSGSGGSRSGDSSGGGRSGSGSGGSGGDDHGGRRGSDDGSGDDHGGRRGGDDRARNDDRRNGAEHINAATGDRVEIAGNSIEVVHPDGTKEEIENGRFEQKNAAGRTVVERPATQADAARLRGFAF